MFKHFPVIFAVIFVLLLGWVVFTQFFASREIIQILYFYQVDKILHMLGGFVVTGTVFKSLRIRVSTSFLLLVLVVILWEVFEWIVLPDVKYLYCRNFPLWRYDTIWDLIAGMMGGLAAIAAYRRRGQERLTVDVT
jgi:hypothetical protein